MWEWPSIYTYGPGQEVRVICNTSLLCVFSQTIACYFKKHNIHHRINGVLPIWYCCSLLFQCNQAENQHYMTLGHQICSCPEFSIHNTQCYIQVSSTWIILLLFINFWKQTFITVQIDSVVIWIIFPDLFRQYMFGVLVSWLFAVKVKGFF